MIGPSALDRDLRPLLRAWPLGVGCDIEQRLPDEGTVAQRRGLSEFLEAPFHDGGYVAAGRAGNVKSKAAAVSRCWSRASASRSSISWRRVANPGALGSARHRTPAWDATSARKALRKSSFSKAPCQVVPHTGPDPHPSRNGSAPRTPSAREAPP